MGKFNPNANTNFQTLKTAVAGGVFSSPAWFNGTLYYGAVGDVLRAFPLADGSFSLNPSSRSTHSFASPGATPSISANGTKNAILWAAENTNPAVLHAYDATNLATELYNSNQAAKGETFRNRQQVHRAHGGERESVRRHYCRRRRFRAVMQLLPRPRTAPFSRPAEARAISR